MFKVWCFPSCTRDPCCVGEIERLRVWLATMETHAAAEKRYAAGPVQARPQLESAPAFNPSEPETAYLSAVHIAPSTY